MLSSDEADLNESYFSELGKLIAQVSNYQRLISSRELKKKGIFLERAQIHVFITISKNEGDYQNQIVEKSQIDKKVLTKIISRLHKNDMIEIRKDSDDGRLKRLYLSDKARAQLPLLRKTLDNVSKSSLFNFEKDEILKLKDMLGKLKVNFETLI